MIPVRVCYFNSCILDLKRECDNPLSGSFSELYTPLFDYYFRGHNVTYVAKAIHERIGPDALLSENSYDDCILSLQNNESDLTMIGYSMPIIGSNLKTGPAVDEVLIRIIWTYNMNSGKDEHTGVLDLFREFSSEVALLSLLFIFMFCCMLTTQSEYTRRYCHERWQFMIKCL